MTMMIDDDFVFLSMIQPTSTCSLACNVCFLVKYCTDSFFKTKKCKYFWYLINYFSLFFFFIFFFFFSLFILNLRILKMFFTSSTFLNIDVIKQ